MRLLLPSLLILSLTSSSVVAQEVTPDPPVQVTPKPAAPADKVAPPPTPAFYHQVLRKGEKVQMPIRRSQGAPLVLQVVDEFRDSQFYRAYVVQAVQKDYVVLQSDSRLLYVPFRSIEMISRAAPKVEAAQNNPFEEALNQRISLNLRRTPLQEVLQIITKVSGVAVVIDGEALKSEGYTKNMPSTLSLDNVPVRDVLLNVIGPYQQLVLVPTNTHLVLTTKREVKALGAGNSPLAPSPLPEEAKPADPRPMRR